ncbi:MAG TPA: CDP-diacylglycerol--glycerol-3-phosphate 3-phosphatidyltransferase [Xanthomonadaceae bacterium]|jgi:CDP-diacylglycerol--glycerol-3-phosphate 3-phosphatidyltransferase|nr:CDP-diacylglycerol--glycerol-3-phosphate 3-phosphatidyltransferase [Xanthomonadaceae bacterium]
MLTIPTALTLFRIVLIPVMVIVFYAPIEHHRFWAALVFAVGALTDWLDGWIARRFDMNSAFGAFLDPVADKLAVAIALIIVVQANPTPLLALLSAVIIGREITISALREWMAAIGARGAVAVAWVGKIKTIVQMVAIVALLIGPSLWLGPHLPALPTEALGEVLLGVAAALTLWSGFDYLRAAWPALARDLR